MDPIRFSIEKPVSVIVGIILVILFGWIGLMSLPYQLSPTVIEPEIIGHNELVRCNSIRSRTRDH